MKKPLILWSIMTGVLYTVLTLLSSTIALAMGNTHDTHAHLLMRFGFVATGVTATVLYLYWPIKEKLTILRYVLPYVVAQGLVLVMVFFTGLATTLHPDAYRDAFFNFTFVAIPIIIGLAVYDRVRLNKTSKV
ncbi:MAG: hypothetical protein EA374_07205 [Acholeplasmatales bacterium]|nr:MAG: hypothetical protein EA374_07205 [Acholeplasmatales bacterium]